MTALLPVGRIATAMHLAMASVASALIPTPPADLTRAGIPGIRP